MNFQNIEQFRSYDFYLDFAISKSKKLPKQSEKHKTDAQRIMFIKDEICGALDRTISKFPSIDSLSEFYIELIKVSTDYDLLKKDLAAINWASRKIDSMGKEYAKKALRMKDNTNIKREYIGRIASLLKQVKQSFDNLEHSRRIFLKFPDVKENYTVCLVGFPNVGKSTLLSRITSASPKIDNYAFTTKSLNTGYFKYRFEDIQVIDSPGTLARFEKMNDVERQAYLAVKYCANVLVFVFDLTENYSLDSQLELLSLMKKFKKKILFYFSKTDIFGEAKVHDFCKEQKISEYYFDSEKLKERLFLVRKNKE